MEDAFPPFEPDGPIDGQHGRVMRKPSRLREVPIRFIIPNIFTVLAICAGLSAVRMALEDRFELAIGLILVSALLDGLDGRVARLMKGSSKFGAELDSLADAINFGVVPSIVLYIHVLDEARQFGWIAALIFTIACVLRLARFNVMSGDRDRPVWQQDFFIGVPAPAGAALVLLPVYLSFLGVTPHWITASVVSIYVIAIGLLMVSSLPVWSAKSFGSGVRRTAVMPLLLSVVFYVAMIANFTWTTVTVSAFAYIAFLPYSVSRYRKAQRANAVTDGDEPKPE
ncbi:MAG: CDP-diacylglycerol--serine O-phosphatidyltransferase [Pseudomonadota bacterium]